MKTLVITYLPSGERSRTLKLLEVFLDELPPGSDLEYLDLLEKPPTHFTRESLADYQKRNYGKKPLSAEETALLRTHDELVEQLKRAHIVVMAYPMYNFGMPGIVKTWFDAVVLSGETFIYTSKGSQGLMKGKKALTLFTSGAEYPAGLTTPEFPYWDSISTLAKIEFQFMGFDAAEVITAAIRKPEELLPRLEEARAKIRPLVKAWY